MKKFIALLSMGLALASCARDLVRVNLDYAKTTYGYVNNGGFTTGSLLLWDTKMSTITALGNVDCTRKSTTPNPIDIETNYKGGIQTSLKLTPGDESLIDAALRSRSSLVAKDIRRFQCTGLITSLADYINANPSALEDWSFADAIDDQSLFYLFVSDITMGDSVELQVDNQAQISAGFPVKLGSRNVRVEIDGSGLGKIRGDDVVLMFNVRVFRPIYVKNELGGRNASFKLINGKDLGTLRDSLRKGV